MLAGVPSVCAVLCVWCGIDVCQELVGYGCSGAVCARCFVCLVVCWCVVRVSGVCLKWCSLSALFCMCNGVLVCGKS